MNGAGLRYTHFEIENFKGIRHLRFDLVASRAGDIFTLVGLNESGKTTILEAINHFSLGAEPTDPHATPRQAPLEELIPIAERDNFNGQVRVSAGLELTDEDVERLRTYMAKYGYLLHSIRPYLEIDEVHGFRNSVHVGDGASHWKVQASGRRSRQKSDRELATGTEEWDIFIEYMRARLPSIRFFPNFAFNIPNRILIGEAPLRNGTSEDEEEREDDVSLTAYRESRVDRFYKRVLQDIIDSLDRDANVKDHILRRAASRSKKHRKSLDALLLNMGRDVTQTVFGSWDEMFGRRPTAAGSKQVRIGVEEEETDDRRRFYVTWEIEDANGLSDIGDQSLGFRWFFVYRLLTAYRGQRKGSTGLLFLFDEPASNLHSSAQALLLKSFERLARDGRIIYTTHSHHLINPKWLESAFVVKNAALDYDAEDFAFTARQTDISVERYRTFAVRHPDQKNYFQPILDVLEYRPSSLELVPDVVMLEGKNDFYTLELARRVLGTTNLHLMPGSGAGNLTNLIALYIGWARNFVVLLDSDSEGERQLNRYRDVFGPAVDGRIFVLGDIRNAWKGRRLESLFNKSDHRRVQQIVDDSASGFDKKLFNAGIQELVAAGRTLEFGARTKDNLLKVIAFLEDGLQTNAD